MKQVILLEPHEVSHLQRGKGLEIVTPGGTIVLRFDANGTSTTNGASAIHTCGKCGKVLKNSFGLGLHMLKKHGIRKGRG